MSGYTGARLDSERQVRTAVDQLQRDFRRVANDDIDVAYPQRMFLRRRSDGARFQLDIGAGPTFTLTADDGTVTVIGPGGGGGGGWVAPNVLTKSAGYTETATSGIQVRLCSLAAGFTVVLPTAVGNTAVFVFKKMLAAGSIVVDGNASQTIDGALTATLTAQYESISLVSDGSNWVLF